MGQVSAAKTVRDVSVARGRGSVLVTGFGPFRHWQVNSSGEAVRLLHRRCGAATSRLTVDHEEAAQEIRGLIAATRPRAVLLTGLAAGAALRLETLARPGPLAPEGGPVVRRGRWPVAAAMAALAAQGVPARTSTDAGGYVCDTTYWAALGAFDGPCLFLHVPPIGGSWTARRIARGIEAVLGVL